MKGQEMSVHSLLSNWEQCDINPGSSGEPTSGAEFHLAPINVIHTRKKLLAIMLFVAATRENIFSLIY